MHRTTKVRSGSGAPQSCLVHSLRHHTAALSEQGTPGPPGGPRPRAGLAKAGLQP